MENLANVSFRIDANLKKQADVLFSSLGLNMTTAFNMFLRQAVREGRIPFEVSINVPNAETVSAMIESILLTSGEESNSYKVEDALHELKK